MQRVMQYSAQHNDVAVPNCPVKITMGLQSYLLHPTLQGPSSHVLCVYVAYAVYMCLCSLCSSRVHCVNVAYVEL